MKSSMGQMWPDVLLLPGKKPSKLVSVPLGEKGTGTSPGMSPGGLRTPTAAARWEKTEPI